MGLYYMHGQELVAIINGNQALNRQGRTLLLSLAPTIKKALARGGPLKISQKQLSAFTKLAAGVKAHASPALAKTTATIEWALNDEQMMRCFNMIIERR